MFCVTLRSTGKIALPVVLALAATGFAQTATPAPQVPASSASAPVNTAAPKIEDRNAFIVVGVTVRTNNAKEAGGQGEIPQIWQNAMQNGVLESIPNKTGDGLVVVYSDYASDNTGDYNYTLGYRVTSADKVPAGMVAKTIHAGKYAALTSEQGPPQVVIPALWQHIAEMTPQQLGGVRAYVTDFETFGNIVDWGSMQMTAHIGLK
jgi:predicted transcriptional regulator YdeE